MLGQQPERVGLCLRDVDLERLARFEDVRGIRIEDDVLVTEGGCRVLTSELPKTPEGIEAVLAEARG